MQNIIAYIYKVSSYIRFYVIQSTVFYKVLSIIYIIFTVLLIYTGFYILYLLLTSKM